MSAVGFAMVDGVLTIEGDPYPGADRTDPHMGECVQITIGRFTLFLRWVGMFEGATSPTATIFVGDFSHDNWVGWIPFSDWAEHGDELVYQGATPADVRRLLSRFFNGWVPHPFVGEDSGVLGVVE